MNVNAHGVLVDNVVHTKRTKLKASTEKGVKLHEVPIPKYLFEMTKAHPENDVIEHRMTPSPEDMRENEREGFEFVATHERNVKEAEELI